jgi:hypothetical protein
MLAHPARRRGLRWESALPDTSAHFSVRRRKSAHTIVGAAGWRLRHEADVARTLVFAAPRVVSAPGLVNAAALQWFEDVKAYRAQPANPEPGIICMLAGATKRERRGSSGWQNDIARIEAGSKWRDLSVSTDFEPGGGSFHRHLADL